MTERTGESTSEGDFGTFFTHWRSGKVYYAKDYGHKVWPFKKRK